MTFADSVLHLVRAGARIDSRSASDAPDSPESPAAAEAGVLAEAVAVADAAPEEGVLEVELAAQAAEADHQFEPGLGDLEAAVGLVSSGLATRVVLSGFQSWPGLLWRAYQLAGEAGVLILPTVVRPGGKVDIVITRYHAANG